MITTDPDEFLRHFIEESAKPRDKREPIVLVSWWPPPASAPPTDAEIVALMNLRGNGSREQPRSSEIGTPVGLAWRGEAITEADAQAAWDRFHASEAQP